MPQRGAGEQYFVSLQVQDPIKSKFWRQEFFHSVVFQDSNRYRRSNLNPSQVFVCSHYEIYYKTSIFQSPTGIASCFARTKFNFQVGQPKYFDADLCTHKLFQSFCYCSLYFDVSNKNPFMEQYSSYIHQINSSRINVSLSGGPTLMFLHWMCEQSI